MTTIMTESAEDSTSITPHTLDEIQAGYAVLHPEHHHDGDDHSHRSSFEAELTSAPEEKKVAFAFKLIHTKTWAYLLLFTIILNTILVIVAITWASSHTYSSNSALEPIPVWFIIADFLVNFVLTIEIYVRWLAYKSPYITEQVDFWSSLATVLDFCIVAFCWLTFIIGVVVRSIYLNNNNISDPQRIEEEELEILGIVANISRIIRDIFSIFRLVSLARKQRELAMNRENAIVSIDLAEPDPISDDDDDDVHFGHSQLSNKAKIQPSLLNATEEETQVSSNTFLHEDITDDFDDQFL